MRSDFIDALIDIAISEDIGDEDHTSKACIPFTAIGNARLLIKEEGILAGINIAAKVFKRIDPEIKIDLYRKDGDKILPGEIAFEVMGRVVSILKSERLVLNFLQRMSGIATQTNMYVSKLKGFKTIILDTRKTTPGFRIFEKMAVEIGGGQNHRKGLYDMILIKDNHIDFAGGIKNAIENVNDYLRRISKNLKVEIEARSLDDVKEILKIGHVDRIMLDNFSLDKTLKAVKLINGKYETESSGNITLRNIREYAECGVDYVSVGALTHQIKSLDMSLKAVDY
ncbi:MAG TPA: carboxylating nicotinate-nucleotide diphosphorylase [Bacteroidales bacterium]|nr:carboxylating nicotinate-nucleotide diphosphorylase [Bacteroidales bacterium]